MQTKKRYLITLSIIILICVIAFLGVNLVATRDNAENEVPTTGEAQSPPTTSVIVTELSERILAPTIEVPGSVVSLNDSRVAAATSGKITWVIETGAAVQQGDVLVEIDPVDSQFALEIARSEVDQLQVRTNNLRALYGRFKGLGEDAGESEVTLDRMEADVKTAELELSKAKAILDMAIVNLSRTKVRAPFDGRLVSRLAQPGEFASPGEELVRLLDTKSLEVTARAQSRVVRQLSKNDTITVTMDKESVSGTLRALIPAGNERIRMLELRVVLPEVSWFVGSAVHLKLPIATSQIVLVAPRDALVLRKGRTSIFLVGEDNKAKRVDVQLGAAEGVFIEVIGENLNVGDKVVIRGAERLRDGEEVHVSNEVAKPAIEDNT